MYSSTRVREAPCAYVSSQRAIKGDITANFNTRRSKQMANVGMCTRSEQTAQTSLGLSMHRIENSHLRLILPIRHDRDACTQEFCKEAKLSTRRENTDAKTNQIRHLSNRQREKKTGANSGTINKRDTASIAFSFKTRTLGLRLAIGLHLDASRVSPQSTQSRCHRRRRH